MENETGEKQKMEPKISWKSVYSGYWKCRDFELSHSWQRSVFLTAFLIACFAGYGGLVVAALGADGLSELKLKLVNGIGFSISLVGILLSLLWIMMAKGSKAWYERWERAIDAFCATYVGEAFESEDVANISGFRIGNIEKFENPVMSGWLWRTDGGPYSPSRINVAIGHLSLIIWFLISVAHVCIAKVGLARLADIVWLRVVLTDPTSMCAVVVFSILLFFWYVQARVKSDVLSHVQ